MKRQIKFIPFHKAFSVPALYYAGIYYIFSDSLSFDSTGQLVLDCVFYRVTWRQDRIAIIDPEFQQQLIAKAKKHGLYKKEIGFAIYEKLGDRPVHENADGDTVLEQDFMQFTRGTDVQAIWHWIESEFDVSLGVELYS